MNDRENIFTDEYWSTTGGGKMLIYNGPYLKENLDKKEVKIYTKKRNAKAAMWTYDYDCDEETCWYHLICDDPTFEIDNISRKKTRYYVRRCFRECEIKEISCEYLLEHGYEVYLKASSRYTNFTPKSEKTFKKEIREACEERDGQPIGVFYEDKLIAYSMVYLRFKSLKIATAFFDPDYSKSNPMYGLYFYFQQYLKNDNCNEVTNGARPLLHETNIDRFLLRMEWRKAYARLGLYLPAPINFALAGAKIARPLWKPVFPNKYANLIDSLLKAKDIANTTSIK